MDTESVFVVDDNPTFPGILTRLLQEQHHNEVVVIGAAWAIAMARGPNLGRLVSETKAAHEAIEAKGRLDAREDLATTSPLEAVQ